MRNNSSRWPKSLPPRPRAAPLLPPWRHPIVPMACVYSPRWGHILICTRARNRAVPPPPSGGVVRTGRRAARNATPTKIRPRAKGAEWRCDRGSLTLRKGLNRSAKGAEWQRHKAPIARGWKKGEIIDAGQLLWRAARELYFVCTKNGNFLCQYACKRLPLWQSKVVKS